MLEVINQFGGGRPFITMVMFLLVFFLFQSLIKNNKLRVVTSLSSSLFISAQLISLYSTQTFLGYQFYVHCNLSGVMDLILLFIPQLTALIFIFVLLTFVYYSSFLITSKLDLGFKKSLSIFSLSIVSLIFLCFKTTFINDTKTLFTILQTDTKGFKDELKRNNLKNYVSPDDIKAERGKNIIVISLESIESGFLSKKHAHLTPNLNRLKQEWNYYDIHPNLGSSWTSGSMYTTLTGFPAFFGKSSNTIFQTSYNSQISSIAHVLKKAKYRTTYMNGNGRSSGVNDMINALGFDKLIDVRNIKKTGHESSYGIRDKDLFELAKLEINKKSQEPFALFISTTDTHYPDGIYDRRMESVISKKSSNLEFMIASLDFMVGDFIKFLEKNNSLENTSIYIYPDHLKMGDPSLFNGTGERKLYLITNSSKRDINAKSTGRLLQIDLPKLILNGAQIKHNQKFLTDYIHGDKTQFIKEQINNLTAINRAGFSRTNAQKFSLPKISKHYLEYKKNTSRYIAHAGGMIDGLTYTNSLDALEKNYAKGFRLFELDIVKTIDGKYVAVHDWDDWKIMTGYTKKTLPTHQEFMSLKLHEKYSPLDMDRINEWFHIHKDAVLVSDKVNQPKEFSSQFIAPDRLIMELFTEQAVKEGVNTNILSAMPTEDVLIYMSWDSIKELKIKHVAISRFFIEEHKDFLTKLKEHDIKVYVYSVNRDGAVLNTGIDEDYVTKYELDYVYGMYADEWCF